MSKLPKFRIVILFIACLYILSTRGHEQTNRNMSTDPNCDDGQSNLCIDWCDDDNGEQEYTCYEEFYYPVDPNIQSYPLDETIPQGYLANHICMDHPIQYPNPFCTFGDHRPIWPTYGIYKFLPQQRWLHSCEHGALVLLYHPCVDPTEFRKLKQIVMNCLRRYIITPYRFVPKDTPFALVTWGHALFLNHYQEEEIVNFIKANAKHGPEDEPDNGGYKFGLIQESDVVSESDFNDSRLCPTSP